MPADVNEFLNKSVAGKFLKRNAKKAGVNNINDFADKVSSGELAESLMDSPIVKKYVPMDKI